MVRQKPLLYEYIKGTTPYRQRRTYLIYLSPIELGPDSTIGEEVSTW